MKMAASKIMTGIILCALSMSCSTEDETEEPNSISSGLVAHYAFANGSMSDLTGNGNNGTASGVVTSADRLGTTSEAINFNSADDYIKVSNPSFINDSKGTFAAWVKFDDLGHTQYVGSAGTVASNENYISLLRLDGTDHTIGIYQRETGQPANFLNGNKIIQTGKYYHLVMVSDGSKWRIYIDGNEETLSVTSGVNNGKWLSAALIDNFVIGSSILKTPYDVPYLSGNIDEVRMYNRALNKAEIKMLFDTTH